MGKFIIKKTKTGGFNFSLYAMNNEKICVSSQIYTAKASCKNALVSIAKNANRCIEEDRILDLTLKKEADKITAPRFEIYFDKQGMYRYRLLATNGENIAISEEGYKSKNGCINGMKSVAVNANNAEVIDETLNDK